MDQTSIKFKFVFGDDYEPEYVNGVYGGVNPNGELTIHFFMDRAAIPNEIIQHINEDGTLDDKNVEVSPEDVMIRRVIKNGVIMPPETALTLFHWLKERLVEMGVDNDDL